MTRWTANNFHLNKLQLRPVILPTDNLHAYILKEEDKEEKEEKDEEAEYFA